jgi:tight adherence protein B
LFGFVGYMLGRGWFLAGVGAVAGLFVPRMYVGSMQRKRLRDFDGQLGDMLNLVVNGLRAGYSSMQALESVSRELPPPISDEFRRVVQEIQLGLPQEAALANLKRRVPSPDLDFVVTAINIQREVGGNLAEILDNISHTIRERVRIKGEIATLTAQGQITAWVISLMPIILALLLFLINRSYMMNVFGPPIMFGVPVCGIIMIVTALTMIGIGFAIVQKIVDIEV